MGEIVTLICLIVLLLTLIFSSIFVLKEFKKFLEKCIKTEFRYARWDDFKLDLMGICVSFLGTGVILSTLIFYICEVITK
jgi:uncharacterized membrane protein